MRLILLTLLVCLLGATSLFANEAKFRVTAIEVVGNDRTAKSVIVTEFEVDPGSMATMADVELGKQRLLNTNIFAEVGTKVADAGEGKIVTIEITERWTTIPIIKFASGGGVNQYILGVYDPNSFGRRIELGAQYERLGKANSGVTWLRYPRLFGERIGLDLQVWRTNRLRTKYIQGPLEAEVLTGFVQTRTRLVLGLDFEVVPWFMLGTFVEYHKDRFSDRYLDDETKEKVVAKGLPVGTEILQRGYKFGLGQLNNIGWQQEGLLLEGRYIQNRSLTDDVDHFTIYESQVTGKWRFFKDALIAQRLMGGWTDTEILQYWYYLGGLDRIRGFADNRFAGSKYWLSNSEVRLPVLYYGPVIIQHVTFYDVAAAAEDTKDLNRVSGSSVGMGARVIAPKVYRFVGRLDFAYNLVRRDEKSISFGVQQFF